MYKQINIQPLITAIQSFGISAVAASRCIKLFGYWHPLNFYRWPGKGRK